MQFDQLGRREFIALLGGTVAWPLAARAQRSNLPRVGYLFSFTQAASDELWQWCRQGLRELSYSEGQNLILEPRWAEERYERLPALVSELLGLKVDVIVTASTPVSLAAKAATNAIPIVFVAVADPVSVGLVATLARPGGNITGLSLLTSDLSGKRLALLMEIVHKISLVTILMNRDNRSNRIFLTDTQLAARQLGVEIHTSDARTPEDIERAFASAAGQRADALIVFDDPVLFGHRTQIVAHAAARKIPAMYGFKDFVVEGGLISYGPDRRDQYRRTAVYVDKILKGTAPADLPVQQAVKFELVVNRKTATSLGLVLPTAIEVSADEVIE
jgi:putative ABC transport system substrate-binding protein